MYIIKHEGIVVYLLSMTTPINATNVILIEKLKIKIVDKYQKKRRRK